MYMNQKVTNKVSKQDIGSQIILIKHASRSIKNKLKHNIRDGKNEQTKRGDTFMCFPKFGSTDPTSPLRVRKAGSISTLSSRGCTNALLGFTLDFFPCGGEIEAFTNFQWHTTTLDAHRRLLAV